MNKLVKSDHIEYVHIYLINWLMNALIWNPDFFSFVMAEIHSLPLEI